jgi:ABC-type antimicrobial peptide transport system permease subunit
LDRTAVVVGVYDAAYGTTRGNGRRIFTADNGPFGDRSYLIRTSGAARAEIPILRDRLRKTLPELPASRAEVLADAIAENQREVLQLGAGAAGGGVLVLLLASIGLYGVIGLALLQRRREIGVRIALGARPGAVVWLLFRQGVRLAAIGLSLGLPLSIAAALLTSRLSGELRDFAALGINPPVIGALITMTVLLVAATATWLPARRAAAVDPMIALRAE